MTNRAVWSVCRMLINVGRRWAVPSPDVLEILHYAICPRCRGDIKAQGWRVNFKHKRKRIYEVTFKLRKTRRRVADDEGGEDEEENDEEDEEEFKVRRPRKLTLGKGRLKRPKADFYV